MVPTTIINNNPVGAMRPKCKTYNKIVRVLDKLGYKYKKEQYALLKRTPSSI